MFDWQLLIYDALIYGLVLSLVLTILSVISGAVALDMFLGEPTHLLVFPILEGGRYHYFPGMWTALIPMIFGIWTLQVMIGDASREKKNV